MARERLSNEEKIKTLRASVLFGALDETERAAIADLAVTKHYAKGESVFSEGDRADGFFIVAKGKVKITKMSVGGKEHILRIFSRGEPFGEAAVFSDRRFPAHAVAAENSVCLYVQRRDLTALIRKQPELALSLLATLSERLKGFTRMIEDLSLKEVSARLAKYLLDLSVKQGGTSLRLDIRKRELASRLGTISETLSRTLNRLKSKKVISIRGDHITILDTDMLKRLSAGYKM
jgi:CRP/FNR family transcriptional regulator